MEEKFENLNDNEKLGETKNNSKLSKKLIILIACLIIIIITMIIVIIILLTSKEEPKNDEEKKEDDKKEDDDDSYEEILEKAGYIEPWHDLYGIKMPNLSYVKNDVIINSFKKEGDNYNETIGEINNGKDYPPNERNIYTLYIPYLTLNRKDKYNGIFLYVHGGSWTGGNKEDIEFLCSRYSKMGYITATMGYTVLSGKYPEYNIYRILDEVTACIENIREQLQNIGFDGTKLEMAIGGVSAGAHLASLYAYTIKKTPIPIKFLINIVGPLSLEPEFWYKPAVYNQTLTWLDPKDIEEALNEGKIVRIFEDPVMVGLMNGFLGNIFSDEDVKEMIVNNKINKDSPKYQEMYKIVQNSFPIKFIDSNTVPTLCEYGGNDSLVGVAMYKYLKELSDIHGNKLDLVYMRYAGHELISYDTEDGINAMREINYQVLKYAQTYFTSDP